MGDDLNKRIVVRSAELDVGEPVRHCDLCWSKLEQGEYMVVELRIVCLPCLERFEDRAADLLPQHRLNFTIGLCERGLFAAGRQDPGPNGLGGRP